MSPTDSRGGPLRLFRRGRGVRTFVFRGSGAGGPVGTPLFSPRLNLMKLWFSMVFTGHVSPSYVKTSTAPETVRTQD